MIAIFGMTGACRSYELPNVTIENIKLKDDIYLVEIHRTKNSVLRTFTITGEMTSYVRKYAMLRPANVQTNRFFINYQRGKCSSQPIGINKFRKNSQKIAEYLQLQNPASYTGHSFRRTSSTTFVDAGAHITAFKQEEGRRSNPVSINDAIPNKNNTAMNVAINMMDNMAKTSNHTETQIIKQNNNGFSSNIILKPKIEMIDSDQESQNIQIPGEIGYLYNCYSLLTFFSFFSRW